MKHLLFRIMVFVFIATLLHAADHDVKEIVEKLDALYRSESSYARVEMEIITPHWQRTLEMKVWTKGTQKTFIRILSPAKERGVSTLRIGNEMWNYLPKTNKVIKIPPSMMMSSWMGSDFNNDDLVHEFSLLTDYHYNLIEPDSAKPQYLYIECIPKKGKPIVWGKVVTTVRDSDYIPVREAYYDEKGNLMRVMSLSKIKVFDGKRIPSVMELVPRDEKNNKTVLRYLNARFNIPLEEGIFSLRNLRADVQ